MTYGQTEKGWRRGREGGRGREGKGGREFEGEMCVRLEYVSPHEAGKITIPSESLRASSGIFNRPRA